MTTLAGVIFKVHTEKFWVDFMSEHDIIVLEGESYLQVEVVKAMESLMVVPHNGCASGHGHILFCRGVMKQERLNLYLIDMKYVRNLHSADDRVSSVSPQIGKQHRIYVGVVVLCNGRKYLIPLSHPVEKHKKMKPRADFDKIYDRHGKLIGVLNYNLMIPVEDGQLQKINLKINPTDSENEKYYKNLCIDEINWCRNNQENIVNKAKVLYDLCTSISEYNGKSRCLDFKKLEIICDRYNSKG